MDGALEIGKTSAAGSFKLFIGVAASTVIMAVGTIILARLLLEAELGLYSAALTPSYMIILFRDWGVNSAIVKYIAHYRASKREEDTYKIIKAGFIFEIITGLILSILSFFLANYVALLFGRPESAPLIAIASLTIFSGSILLVSQSTFLGFEKMELKSATDVCQAVVKSLMSPLLVFLGYGVLGAVVGHTLSLVITAAISLAFLYFAIIRKWKTKSTQKTSLSKTLKEMLHYGVPISISSILGCFLAQFYAFLIVIYCSNTILGNYKIAMDFAIILTFITTPISTILFPAFSKVDAQNRNELLQAVFVSSVKYTSLVLVPATLAMMVLSKPMIGTLFGGRYSDAPFFLTLYVIGNLFALFGSLSLGNLLAGVGETKTIMILSLVTFAIGAPIALILIPQMEIVGYMITSIVAGLPSMFLGLYYVWKRYKAKADLKSSFKIFVASSMAAATAFLILNFITCADWIELVVGGIVFLVTYLFAAPILGAVNKSDINNLKVMFSGLGIISKLLNIPLTTMEKLVECCEDNSTRFKLPKLKNNKF